MQPNDEARLAEIRADANNHDSSPHLLAGHVLELLGKLDAAARPHDASFVTRAMFDQERCRAEVAETSAANLAAALAASEAKLGAALRWVSRLSAVSDPFLGASPDEIDRVRKEARAALRPAEEKSR